MARSGSIGLSSGRWTEEERPIAVEVEACRGMIGWRLTLGGLGQSRRSAGVLRRSGAHSREVVHLMPGMVNISRRDGVAEADGAAIESSSEAV